jgi:dienelactone hydrolase
MSQLRNICGLAVVSLLAAAGCSSTETNPTPAPPINTVSNPTPDGGKPVSEPDSGTNPGVDSGTPDATVPPDQGVPPLPKPNPDVDMYTTTVAGSNDPANIYFPKGNPAKSLPVVVISQGAKVDKSNYTKIAKTLAGYGFAVIVPNHKRMVFVDNNFYPETSSILAAFKHVVTEAGTAGSPVNGLVDTGKLAIVGHSFGGVVGTNMIGNTCMFPFCTPPYAVPAELKGGVFYGTSLKGPIGPIPATANAGRGVALIQGSVDGKNKAADARDTYDKVAGAPRAYILLNGTNHYGVTDTDNPAGADADAVATSLPQAAANDLVGTYAAAFLRATVLNDAAAKAFLQSTAPRTNVTVTTAL